MPQRRGRTCCGDVWLLGWNSPCRPSARSGAPPGLWLGEPGTLSLAAKAQVSRKRPHLASSRSRGAPAGQCCPTTLGSPLPPQRKDPKAGPHVAGPLPRAVSNPGGPQVWPCPSCGSGACACPSWASPCQEGPRHPQGRKTPSQALSRGARCPPSRPHRWPEPCHCHPLVRKTPVCPCGGLSDSTPPASEGMPPMSTPPPTALPCLRRAASLVLGRGLSLQVGNKWASQVRAELQAEQDTWWFESLQRMTSYFLSPCLDTENDTVSQAGRSRCLRK